MFTYFWRKIGLWRKGVCNDSCLCNAWQAVNFFKVKIATCPPSRDLITRFLLSCQHVIGKSEFLIGISKCVCYTTHCVTGLAISRWHLYLISKMEKYQILYHWYIIIKKNILKSWTKKVMHVNFFYYTAYTYMFLALVGSSLCASIQNLIGVLPLKFEIVESFLFILPKSLRFQHNEFLYSCIFLPRVGV